MRWESLWVAVPLLLLGWIAPAAVALTPDDEIVKRTIARGIGYLKRSQTAEGTWDHSHPIGATALAGLTLLECGVPAKDPAVQKAAQVVRASALNAGEGEATYTLALAIMFLDRLGAADDVALIRTMTVRLVAGQNAAGGWTYNCPAVSAEQVRQLVARGDKLTEAQHKLRTRDKSRDPRAPVSASPPAPAPQGVPSAPGVAQVFGGFEAFPGGDNSNTQFATLALWVGARHGVPVADALAKVEDRFRKSQNADGGWSYQLGGGVSSATMTCAGLLGLAVGHGVRATLEDAAKGDGKDGEGDRGRNVLKDDPNIRIGLLVLATAIGTPMGKWTPTAPLPALIGQRYSFYYLWSLERVAVAYGLRTIGHKDWYTWGAQCLIASQVQQGPFTGAWAGDERGAVDTCFALLFLRRANLAQDLTTKLRGRFPDPFERTLKTGGVGGKGLKNLPSLAISTQKASQGGRGPAPAAPKTDDETARLADALVRAPVSDQERLINNYQEKKGGVYTQALASAIHRLEGPAKEKARDALRDRLLRMTAATLREKLKDEDMEVRSAAALACGTKEDKQHIPDLIPLLKDPERRVVRAAHIALKSLTGQDFGPGRDATAADYAKAAVAWEAWWKKQPSR